MDPLSNDFENEPDAVRRCRDKYESVTPAAAPELNDFAEPGIAEPATTSSVGPAWGEEFQRLVLACAVRGGLLSKVRPSKSGAQGGHDDGPERSVAGGAPTSTPVVTTGGGRWSRPTP